MRRNLAARGGSSPTAGLRLPRVGLLPKHALTDWSYEDIGGSYDDLLARADSVCAHTVDLLGSGPVQLDPLDWHADIPIARGFASEGLHDVKFAWELSRCQHLVWLGQAYLLSGDERYAREAVRQIDDWIAANPMHSGGNWAFSMEVAIRAVNWLWTWHLLLGCSAVDATFEERLLASLYEHGEFIAHNLENRGYVTNNHHLCCIAGLVYLGCLMPELTEVRSWRSRGLHALEKEMGRQVYDDGVSFEGSTSYHRLACEVFLSCTLLAQRWGHVFSEAYMVRLERMIEAVMHLTGPDGRTPLVGDCDNGRLHRLAIWSQDQVLGEWSDYRHLLTVGGELFDRPDFAAAAGRSAQAWQEAYWFCDTVPLADASVGGPRSMEMQDAGWYVLRDGPAYALVVAGKPGQGGFAGHNHNDQLSVVYQDEGVHWLEDAGTGVYSGDPDLRNRLRSATSHSVLVVDGIEPNGIPKNNLFMLHVRTWPWLESWDGQRVTLGRRVGERPSLEHRRSVWLEDGGLVIRDQLDGKGRHQVAVRFCLGLGISARLDQEGVVLEQRGVHRCLVGSSSFLQARFEEQPISRGYGHVAEAQIVVFEGTIECPLDVTWRLMP